MVDYVYDLLTGTLTSVDVPGHGLTTFGYEKPIQRPCPYCERAGRWNRRWRNFGEGHLPNMQMLRSIPEQCDFEEGEFRCIFVESQPMGRPTHAWTIAHAATGVQETGQIAVEDLLDLQPWPPMPEG